MASLIKTQCFYPGCSTLVERADYCLEHRSIKHSGIGIQESKKFYNSGRWQKLRRWWLGHNPYCQVCKRPGNQVDHIKPMAAGGHPMELDNLQTLCVRCHAIKTAKENRIGI